MTSCQPQAPQYTAYLFAYFTGNAPGQEQVHYAISKDGYNYRALNNNQPVIASNLQNNIVHNKITPYWPQANGQCENS